jgi:hypothetical protein
MRTLERLYRRGMSRRQFLQRSAALGISTTAAVAFFAACGLALALWGTLSPSIRNAPSLAELDDLGAAVAP